MNVLEFLFCLAFIGFLPTLIHWVSHPPYFLMSWFLDTPAKNPLTGDTYQQRYREFLCRKNDHLYRGPYYGMQQAHCRRCGSRTCLSRPDVDEWLLPWDDCN